MIVILKWNVLFQRTCIYYLSVHKRTVVFPGPVGQYCMFELAVLDISREHFTFILKTSESWTVEEEIETLFWKLGKDSPNEETPRHKTQEFSVVPLWKTLKSHRTLVVLHAPHISARKPFKNILFLSKVLVLGLAFRGSRTFIIKTNSIWFNILATR